MKKNSSMSQTVKFSIKKLSAICVLSPNNPERKKTIPPAKKKFTAIKSISCNHGECFKQKRYTVFIKKKNIR